MRQSKATEGLETYLVGGAVRDRLLGVAVQDRDWVVIGSNPEEMIRRGFQLVGKEFPVFQHPESREEYALARRERKQAPGYRGFETDSSPEVTLEEDLKRRDLTVNSMAMDRGGTLIDPFGGSRDLETRWLRHTSEAFHEDPVRVLRAARFLARLRNRGFRIHPGTLKEMKRITESREADALEPQRVWQELHGSLTEPNPEAFVEALRECGALEKILPEVNALFGVPQPPQHHPEIDTGEHILLCLKAARRMSDDPRVLFAVLMHDLGKGLTPVEELPKHRGHEKRGITPVQEVCERLNAPNEYRKLALQVCELHLLHHRIGEMKPKTIFKLLNQLDGFRKPENVTLFNLCCDADIRGRKGMENRERDQSKMLAACHQAALQVDGGAVARKIEAAHPGGRNGEQIRQEINRLRRTAIAGVKNQLLCELQKGPATGP